jgi:hypothetical protein
MTTNKELSVLKWVGILLACLSTVFTLTIVGSHLSGRFVGWMRVGIIGTVGAELMAVTCAWFVASERKRVARVAMICQVILTAVLLVNASIASDIDWQETLAGKAVELQTTAGQRAAEERRKTLEKQAELALQLVEKDKRLAREFVRAEKMPELSSDKPSKTAEPILAQLDVRKLTAYERYGLTVMPLFLALLTLIALAMAAQSSEAGEQNVGEQAKVSVGSKGVSTTDCTPVLAGEQISEHIPEDSESSESDDGHQLEDGPFVEGGGEQKERSKSRVGDDKGAQSPRIMASNGKQPGEQSAHVISLAAAHRKGPSTLDEQTPDEQSAQWLKSLLPEASNGNGWWEVRAKPKGFAIMFRWRDPDLQVLTLLNVARDQLDTLKQIDAEDDAKSRIKEQIVVSLRKLSHDPAKCDKARTAAEKLGTSLLVHAVSTTISREI